ncbi:diguanylate cyclase [Bacillus pinisoli]|uniref:bifunctional diguanylate cyclase/phosphohydrolase n=1 Tax=Bacillus pinisoli TaxID=2901866 RepID=UPI001FF5B56D|nr:diguanylate cyclase [Bacillus pinisoli]
MERNKSLLIYQIFCLIIFSSLFTTLFQPISLDIWIVVVTFAAAAVLFELRPIVLPSGDNLSMVTPLLFTAGLLYGVYTIFLICILMFIILSFINPKKWVSNAFNSIQFSISGYVGFIFYNFFTNTSIDSYIVNIPAFIAFSICFYISNVLLLSTYLSFRSKKPLKTFFKVFFERKAVLIFFTMKALGLILAVVVQHEGMLGMIVFCTIMWTLGISYRSYYNMFEHFRNLSEKDELTKLYNHRYFQEQLGLSLKQNERTALLLIDIDHFKNYNDTFGHPQGDQLLRELAQIFMDTIPTNGLACRYGGEEFAIILPNTNTNEAIAIAESIRLKVANTSFYGVEHMPQKRITVSIGVSTSPEMGTKREQLIMLADQALYKTKYSSRNKVQLYTSVIDELKGNYVFSSRDEEEVLQSLRTFLMIIHSKDRYTYGHTERIMEYAENLAKKIGLSPSEVKNVRYGALLHDIGKVEVPTEVLNKTTKLDQDEWETIKMHVIWGEQMVEPIEELHHCLPMIRHHHERFDGRGYPNQLSGHDIPLEARILTIADCFDAMTTNRPYQKAKSIPEAIEEIIRCSGSQFDPDLIDPFIEVISELRPEVKLAIKEKHVLNKVI